MLVPAIHYLSLCLYVALSAVRPGGSTLAIVVALQGCAFVMYQETMEVPGDGPARRAAVAHRVSVVLTLIFVALSSIPGSSFRSFVLATTTLACGLGLLMAARRTGRGESQRSSFDDLPGNVTLLLAAQAIGLDWSGWSLPVAAIACSFAVALQVALPFQRRRIDLSWTARAVLITVLAVGISVALLVRAPAAGTWSPLVAIVGGSAAVATAVSAVRSTLVYKRSFSISVGLYRSLLVYFGHPLRIVRTRRMYRRFLSSGDLAFDVGAHVGDRTAALRTIGARVVSVEPQPAFAELLRLFFAGDSQVEVLECCLGPEPGEVELQISTHNPTLTTASPQWLADMGALSGTQALIWDRRLPREQRTLDDLTREFGVPLFVKIDVEGYEASVIKGLSTQIESLSIEYLRTAPDPTREAVDLLKRLGPYRFNLSPGESMRFVKAAPLSGDEVVVELGKITHRHSGDIYASTNERALRRSTPGPATP